MPSVVVKCRAFISHKRRTSFPLNTRWCTHTYIHRKPAFCTVSFNLYKQLKIDEVSNCASILASRSSHVCCILGCIGIFARYYIDTFSVPISGQVHMPFSSNENIIMKSDAKPKTCNLFEKYIIWRKFVIYEMISNINSASTFNIIKKCWMIIVINCYFDRTI